MHSVSLELHVKCVPRRDNLGLFEDKICIGSDFWSIGAGRIAYYFKWEGPTYSLDSACASSTSATHLACMSLLSKDIDMAVVGAANILGYPHSWTSLSKSGVLSDTGNCKTYRKVWTAIVESILSVLSYSSV